MINLSLDKLRLIVQIRNISNYKNKSKEDLIKALSETKQNQTTNTKTRTKTTNTKTKTRNKS